MQEPQVQSLGWEDSPGAGNGNPLQYSCQDNPMDRGAWGLQSMVLQRVGHDWSDWAHMHMCICSHIDYTLSD